MFGPEYKPVADVEFQTVKEEWIEFIDLKIDTGAIITLMNSSDCESLGYSLVEGDKKTLSTASGSPLDVSIHKIRIRIGGVMLPNYVRIAFALKPINNLLLGRLDIFDRFDILFNPRDCVTSFYPKFGSSKHST